MRVQATRLPFSANGQVLRRGWKCGTAIPVGIAPKGLTAIALALATLAMQAAPANAQGEGLPPTSSTVPCPAPASQDLVMPPELVSSGGILTGTLNLTQDFQRLPPASPTSANCRMELLR